MTQKTVMSEPETTGTFASMNETPARPTVYAVLGYFLATSPFPAVNHVPVNPFRFVLYSGGGKGKQEDTFSCCCKESTISQSKNSSPPHPMITVAGAAIFLKKNILKESCGFSAVPVGKEKLNRTVNCLVTQRVVPFLNLLQVTVVD